MTALLSNTVTSWLLYAAALGCVLTAIGGARLWRYTDGPLD